MTQYEHLVCHCVYGKAIWENYNKWLGTIATYGPFPKFKFPDIDIMESLDRILALTTISAIEFCPDISDYLNKKGKDGWELITVIPETYDSKSIGKRPFQTLYLKRAF